MLRVAVLASVVSVVSDNSSIVQLVATGIALGTAFLALHRANEALEQRSDRVEGVLDENRDALRAALWNDPPSADG